jgi:stress response protein YsnF
VVNKEARVKEELVVNKDVNQRTETVSDTVRRTEVDVQDERGNRDPRSSSGITDRNR